MPLSLLVSFRYEVASVPVAVAYLVLVRSMPARRDMLIPAILLIGIASLGVAGFVYVKRSVDIAGCARVANDSAFFRAQLERYRKMHGAYPSTEQGLQALVGQSFGPPEADDWIGEIPPDEWDTPYIYRCPGRKHPDGYDLFSAGPDRKADTADDVWRE